MLFISSQAPNAVYLLQVQCCFIAANIVWAGQCDNSLFLWKLTAQQTMNTAIPLPDFSETITAKFQLAAYLLKIRFTTCQIRVIHLPLQNILSSTNWNLWWIGCVQLRRGQSSSTRETRDANWSPDRAGWLTQVMAQPLSLSEELKRQVQTATQTMGKKAQKHL